MKKKICGWVFFTSAVSFAVTSVLIILKNSGWFYNEAGADGKNFAEILSETLTDIAPWLLVAFVLQTVIAFITAWLLSRALTESINKIDLDRPEETNVYPEIKPLVKRISQQNEQINEQIEYMKTEHKKQDDMRRDFTANVSHELKTPLTSISGYAEIIKNGIARPEDAPGFAGKIYDESQRLITLVGDIIKLSQLDEQTTPDTPEEIDLFELCDTVISELEMPARTKKVAFNLKGEHIKIFTSRKIAEEVVFNICDNAVKYNKENGSVYIEIKQCVDGVELSVTDTGIGISKEDLGHIFERFFRVDKSHSKIIGGTGLGLSIVKHGAKSMDASVMVESEPGLETTVRLLF